nr:hypothetical protein [Tanacetum cinerariifolium]
MTKEDFALALERERRWEFAAEGLRWHDLVIQYTYTSSIVWAARSGTCWWWTLIQEGLVSARSKGRVGGRPPGLSTEAERTAATAEMLYRTQDLSLAEITQRLCISKNTLYKYLRHRQVPIDTYRKRAA